MYHIWRTGAVLWKVFPPPTQGHSGTQTNTPVKCGKCGWKKARIQELPADFNSYQDTLLCKRYHRVHNWTWITSKHTMYTMTYTRYTLMYRMKKSAQQCLIHEHSSPYGIHYSAFRKDTELIYMLIYQTRCIQPQNREAETDMQLYWEMKAQFCVFKCCSGFQWYQG